MARKPVQVNCTEEELRELERLSLTSAASDRLKERARIVLNCLAGKRNSEVARELGVRANLVAFWRRRFATERLQGLRDHPRTGKPPRYSEPQLNERLAALLKQTPPAGYQNWDGRLLAEALGVPKHHVWRLLRKHGIHLAQRRYWCVRTETTSIINSATVAGLFLSQADQALVIATNTQSGSADLDTFRGFVRTPSDTLVRELKRSYRSQGKLSLADALKVATQESGQVEKRWEFAYSLEQFLHEVAEHHGHQAELHLIVSRNKPQDDMQNMSLWYDNTHVYTLATAESWTIQAGLWLSVLMSPTATKPTTPNRDDLPLCMTNFLIRQDHDKPPFVWILRRPQGFPFRNNIANLCKSKP